jgi:acylphosphatase
MSSPSERRHVFYSGRVQGVGFRYTTRGIAERYAVSGFVRNLVDGRVELVAEGAPAELDRFLGEVNNELGRYIGHAASTTDPSTGEFAGFTIRH